MAEVTPGLPKTNRWFIDCDDSGHRYLVPADKRVEWDEWQDIPSDDERSWDAPDFAVRLGMTPNHLEFTLPRFSDEEPALPVVNEGPFDKAALEARGICVAYPKRLANGQIWWAPGAAFHDGKRMWTLKDMPNVGLSFDSWVISTFD